MDWRSDYCLYEKISQFLEDNNIKDYFDPYSFCKIKGWNLIPYDADNYNHLLNISEDGFSVYENNEYYIFYNPLMYEFRINFTLSHEIGHIILLHHHFVPNKVLMSSNSYNSVWERQANIFARNVLMPAKEFKHLRDLNRRPYVEGSKYGVSNQALQVRWNTLNKDIKMLNTVIS